MARTANPNKEKIEEIKDELKEHKKNVSLGAKSEKKIEALETKLEKLKGGDAKKPAAKEEDIKKKPGRPAAKKEEPKKAAKKIVKKKKKSEDDED